MHYKIKKKKIGKKLFIIYNKMLFIFKIFIVSIHLNKQICVEAAPHFTGMLGVHDTPQKESHKIIKGLQIVCV